MVIAFNSIVCRKLRVVGGSQLRDRSLEADRGKVICIVGGAKLRLERACFEPEDEPEYEPPIGA